MAERSPKLVGYDECRCILQQYCDGTCRPIFDDADAVDEARVLYANHPVYRGTTPLPWHYAPLSVRMEWVAKAKAARGVVGVAPHQTFSR